jgi:chemotaxis protein CheD
MTMERRTSVHIHIGGFYASQEPAVIRTLLGSCVSVCLFDPVNRIGGMNHILLPGSADLRHFNEPARYGINAMELLINRIMNLGGDRNRLVAKVFGGSHLFHAISRERGTGEKNASFVFAFLKNDGIRILSHDLGGRDARRIYFRTDTGEVFLKRISFVHHVRVAQEEALGFRHVRNAAHKPGEVTLFYERPSGGPVQKNRPAHPLNRNPPEISHSSPPMRIRSLFPDCLNSRSL